MDLTTRVEQCFKALQTIADLPPADQQRIIEQESIALINHPAVPFPTSALLRTTRDRALEVLRREP